MADDPGTLRHLDERILRYLVAEGPEYPALIAGAIGAHAPLVERRCEALVGRGLVVAVTGEVVYHATPEGRELIEE
jgi:DNA-binding MarR family transcriptional regulator